MLRDSTAAVTAVVVVVVRTRPRAIPLAMVHMRKCDDFMHGAEGSKGGVGSRSRFTENKLVPSQITRNKICIARFTRKWHFLTRSNVTCDV